MFKGLLAGPVQGILDLLTTSSISLSVDPFTWNGVTENYSVSQRLAASLLAVFIIFGLVGVITGSDLTNTAKLKRSLFDLFFVAIAFLSIQYFASFSQEIVTSLALEWSKTSSFDASNLGGALVTTIGIVSGTTAVSSFGYGLIILIGIFALIVLLIVITDAIASFIMTMLIVLFPLVMAIYPLQSGKQWFSRWLTSYLGLLMLPAIQTLAVSLVIKSADGTMSVNNILHCIGGLIVVSLIIPGALFFVIMSASNAKVIE